MSEMATCLEYVQIDDQQIIERLRLYAPNITDCTVTIKLVRAILFRRVRDWRTVLFFCTSSRRLE
jgi:hypothetical protein